MKSSLDSEAITAVFLLLEDPILSNKGFAQACRNNPFYAQRFGPPKSSKRNQSRTFYQRRRDEREAEDPSSYIIKCIEAGVEVNKSDKRIYSLYIQINKIRMPTPPKFSSPQQDPLSPDGMPEQIYSSSSEGKSVAQKLYEEALLDPSVNHPGVRLVSYCNGGLVSCHYWSPVMLDHLQVEVREDAAYGELNNVVIEDATELYNQYPSWNKDRSNNVIAAMNDTLKEVTRRMKDAPKEAGDRAPIIKFREPVQPEIVTPQGAPGGEIKWEQCADGRWRISFFVRTLASMKKEKETGRFASTLSNVEVDEREEERM